MSYYSDGGSGRRGDVGTMPAELPSLDDEVVR